MTQALAWLAPRPVHLLTSAIAVTDGLDGARYDGLVRPTTEDGLGAVDLLAGPEGRAASLRHAVPAGAALARASAAWVHTGRERPRRTDVVVEPHLRVHASVVVHRQHLQADDVVRVGGVPTTTPLRTAVDLLCFADVTVATQATCALLTCGLDPDRVRAALSRPGRRLPVRRARELLAAAEETSRRRRP